MSKSLYEKYAEEAQPGVLAKTISLEEAVATIKGYTGRFSTEYIEWAEEICAEMFERTFEEVRDLVEGKQHWISVAGMYEENGNKSFDSEFVIKGDVYMSLGYDGLEDRNYIQFGTEGHRLLNARLSAIPVFHNVSVKSPLPYAGGCVFNFSFTTDMNIDAIRRTLSGMFSGLKHSFYIDHNLDARLADAASRSESISKERTMNSHGLDCPKTYE